MNDIPVFSIICALHKYGDLFIGFETVNSPGIARLPDGVSYSPSLHRNARRHPPFKDL